MPKLFTIPDNDIVFELPCGCVPQIMADESGPYRRDVTRAVRSWERRGFKTISVPRKIACQRHLEFLDTLCTHPGLCEVCLAGGGNFTKATMFVVRDQINVLLCEAHGRDISLAGFIVREYNG